MTHAEQIKKRIKYFKMSIVHDEYGEVKWLCDSLTLAVEALVSIKAPRAELMEYQDTPRDTARNCLTKISHGRLEAGRTEGQ